MLLTMRVLVLIFVTLLFECGAQTIDCEEMTITVDITPEVVVLTWTPNSCAQRYIVRHYVNGVNELEQPITHPMSSIPLARNPCSRNTVTIDLEKNANAGEFTEASIDFVVGLSGDSAVRDLHFNAGSRRFEWLPPEGAERCELEYEIDFSNGLTAENQRTTDEFHEFPLLFCSSNLISVTTIIGIEDKVGDSVSDTHSEGAPDVLEVQNLRFDQEQNRFLWEGPDKSELCEVQYKVDFQSNIVSTQDTITEKFYEIFVYPCSSNEIGVTTILGFDGSQSDTVTFHHLGPAIRQPPLHISTDPHQGGATVAWLIETEANNFCRITDLRFEVENSDDIVNSFSGYGVKEFELTSLEAETIYRYRLCFVFEAPIVDTVCSQYVSFLTEPLSRPTINVQTNDDHIIQIYWQQSYHPDFVTGHLLFIEPKGPNHFIPSGCPVDTDAIESSFDAATTSYYFDAKPSFEYRIRVETQFQNLGMTTTSDEITIITTEGTPGVLGVESFFEYAPSVAYSASLIVEWTIPCNINGNVKTFAYTIYGTANFDGVCNDFTLDSGVVESVGENRETYSVTTPGVLPFFRYSIAIITSLQDHDGLTEAQLKDPPQPYTP